MVHDFFLVERAAQIQRLRSGEGEDGIEVPGRLSRSGYSAAAVQLFQALDRIADIPLGEGQTGFLPWLKNQKDRWIPGAGGGSSSGGKPILNPKHQAVLLDFEKLVVQCLVSDDGSAAGAAAPVVSAIVRDHQNFIGWKPLQFQGEEFAHELLFPSWLNLYCVLTLPYAHEKTPRFDEAQLAAVFGFLEEFESQHEPVHDEIIGAMTFLAHRLPRQAGERSIQRIIDLGTQRPEEFVQDLPARIERLRDHLLLGDELLAALRGMIVCDGCRLSDEKPPAYQVVPKRLLYAPLPKVLSRSIHPMPEDKSQLDDWAELVTVVGRIVDHVDVLDKAFVALLEKSGDRLREWLALAAPAGNPLPLSAVAQGILARLVEHASAGSGPAEPKQFQGFAKRLAARLEPVDTATAEVFIADFIQPAANRELLMRHAESEAGRRKIANQLVSAAKSTQDRTKLLSRLMIASVIDPDCTDDQLRKMGRTLQILSTLQVQGCITPKQLEDLVTDIRQRLPDSMKMIATPLYGTAGSPPALARLYLALNEVCEIYDHSGKVINFGMARAAYSNLERDAEDSF